MNQVYKQMIVMLTSITFIGIVAVIVMSSSAAASIWSESNAGYIRDANLDRAESVLSGDYYQSPTYNNPSSGGYQSDIYTPSQSPIDNSFYDAMEEYKRDMARDDAIVQNGIIRDARREAATEKTPTPRPQPTNHQPLNLDWGFDGVIGAVVLLIIGVMVIFTIFAYFNGKVTYKTDTDMTDEYANRTAQAATEIECEYMDMSGWIDDMDEYDRREAQAEIEREWK